MLRVVIHAGMHKTGTTSLQSCLAVHRTELAESGVWYPDLGADHQGTLLNVKRPGWHGQAVVEVCKAALRRGARTLVLSGEVVSTFSPQQFAALTACFVGCDLSYMFCLRHWYAYLPSRWRQYCRRRDSQTFIEYLTAITARPHVDLRFDLALQGARDSGAVGVIAVSYDAAIQAEGDVVPTLLRAIGVDLTPTTSIKNRTGDWREIEVLRLLNGCVADHLGLVQDDHCRAIGDHRRADRHFDLGNLAERLPTEQRQALRAIVTQHAVRQEFRLSDRTDAVEKILFKRFSDHFVNIDRHRLFADAPETTRIECVDLTWSEFAARNPELTKAVVSALVVPSGQIAGRDKRT